jgi:hypothetical protein
MLGLCLDRECRAYTMCAQIVQCEEGISWDFSDGKDERRKNAAPLSRQPA